MSKFNHYAVQLDDIVKVALKEYTDAVERLKKAEAGKRDHPRPTSDLADASHVAAAARAEAEYAEASKALHDAKVKMQGTYREQIKQTRRELEAEVTKAYMADPAKVDTVALELLKSGILGPGEYVHMWNEAVKTENHTMARLIGKYAGEAAAARAEKHGTTDPDAAQMRQVENAARQYDGRERMAAFDHMVDLYERACREPEALANLPRWEKFTAGTVEAF